MSNYDGCRGVRSTAAEIQDQKPCKKDSGEEPAFNISEHQVQFTKSPEYDRNEQELIYKTEYSRKQQTSKNSLALTTVWWLPERTGVGFKSMVIEGG